MPYFSQEWSRNNFKDLAIFLLSALLPGAEGKSGSRDKDSWLNR
jgi:hypothetical protein